MREFEVELSVGDTLHVGDYVLTVVDIEGSAVSFHIESLDSLDADNSENSADSFRWSPR